MNLPSILSFQLLFATNFGHWLQIFVLFVAVKIPIFHYNFTEYFCEIENTLFLSLRGSPFMP